MEKQILTFEAEKVKLNSGLFKDFVVCTAYLMSDGVNRNRSEFTLESLQGALPTFENKPVLANIWFNKQTSGKKEAFVGGHDYKVETDENGEEYISYKGGETPVGVITNKSDVAIQKYKGRNFVVAKLFLWKQYNPELIKILARDKKKKVSVEIIATEYEDYINDEGDTIRKILAFDFQGVTILGHRKGFLGEVETIEEGIEGSHLELEEYALAYGKALDKITNNRKDIDDYFQKEGSRQSHSIDEKRTLVLEELNNISQHSEDISILALNSSEFSNEVAGRYFDGEDLYRFKGNINLDGTCDIYESKLETENSKGIWEAQLEYLKSQKTNLNLIINEVNLVPDIELIDVDQLIYKIFTYCNSKDIVNLTFGIIDEQWEDNPYFGLHYPIALLQGNSVQFSEKRIEQLPAQRLEELYQYIKSLSCSQEVENKIKKIMEEKYETGDKSRMEDIETEAKTFEEETMTAEQNEEFEQETQEKVEKIDEEEKIEQAAEKEEGSVEENGCKEEINEQSEEAPAEEPKTEEADEEFAEEDGDDDGDDDGEDTDDTDADDDKKDEMAELQQKYSIALSQIERYTEQVEELSAQVEKLNESLLDAGEKLEESSKIIRNLKMDAFVRDVEIELANSSLDEANRASIIKMAKEEKFDSIIEAQKEIAFLEKQNKSDTYTFVSKVLSTAKSSVEGKTVFDTLAEKNRW